MPGAVLRQRIGRQGAAPGTVAQPCAQCHLGRQAVAGVADRSFEPDAAARDDGAGLVVPGLVDLEAGEVVPADCRLIDAEAKRITGELLALEQPIDALIKATQPEVSGRLYSFSCYRATEYVMLRALAFLILIGTMLLAEGFQQHISKGYIYFAMGFSVFVEMINLRVRGNAAPVQLRSKYSD